jgi:hypothetical protein
MRSKAQVALRETQKNDVFRLVVNQGFDPSDFEWDVATTGFVEHTIDRIVHRPSGGSFFFAFDIIPGSAFGPSLEGDRLGIFSPGPEHMQQRASAIGWDGQLRHVALWLAALRQEVDTVSIWDTIGSATARQVAEANLPNRSLTKDEQRLIQLQVVQVRVYIRANVDDPATLKRIEKKLDELVESSKRLGVKDFANASLGLILGIAMTAAFNGHQAQELVNLFFNGVHVLLGG